MFCLLKVGVAISFLFSTVFIDETLAGPRSEQRRYEREMRQQEKWEQRHGVQKPPRAGQPQPAPQPPQYRQPQQRPVQVQPQLQPQQMQPRPVAPRAVPVNPQPQVVAPTLSSPTRSFPFAPRDIDMALVRKEAGAMVALYTNKVLTDPSPWEVSHGLLGVGREMRIRLSSEGGRIVNALDWFLQGGRFDGNAIFEKTDTGVRGRPAHPPGRKLNAGMEGHPHQFLGYLAELDVAPETEIQAFDLKTNSWVTARWRDVIEDAQNQTGVNVSNDERYEFSWILWGLTPYVNPVSIWRNSVGTDWNLMSVMKTEVNSPIVENTSCGGTHRAYAIAYSVQKYFERYRPFDEGDVLPLAKKFIADHIQLAQSYQNEDGSLSAARFAAPRMGGSWDERVTGNGHMLEFLVRALPQERLKEDWVRRAVYSVALDLKSIDGMGGISWGAVYHGVHGLRVYLERAKE